MQTNVRWLTCAAPFDRYLVSETGLVRDCVKGRLLKLTRSTLAGKPGYVKASLVRTDNGERKLISVHRIVAKAFVLGDHSLDVNHKDSDRANNHWTNLEWMSHGDNMRHAIAKAPTWCDHLRPWSTASRKPVTATKEGVATRFESIRAAALSLGHANKSANIKHAIDTGRAAYGYQWNYA